MRSAHAARTEAAKVGSSFSSRLNDCSNITISRIGVRATTEAVRRARDEEPDLAEEVARAELRQAAAVSDDLRLSLLDHEELVREVALGADGLTRRKLDPFRQLGSSASSSGLRSAKSGSARSCPGRTAARSTAIAAMVPRGSSAGQAVHRIHTIAL